MYMFTQRVGCNLLFYILSGYSQNIYVKFGLRSVFKELLKCIEKEFRIPWIVYVARVYDLQSVSLFAPVKFTVQYDMGDNCSTFQWNVNCFEQMVS